jgi:DNA-binding beta-propeller fold protein YncE
MEEVKRTFEPGDFIKENNKKGSFLIFEGNDISQYKTVKKLTTLCFYNPEKYKMTALGYDQVPDLEVATKRVPCSKTIDTPKEDYWYSLCTQEEKLRAIKVLDEYGYYWDSETFSLIDTSTREVIKKITTPDNTYYGQIIKPITDAFKNMLKRFCYNANKPTVSPCYSQGYEGYYDD